MANKQVLVDNFWPITAENLTSQLTQEQLGWEKNSMVASGSNNSKDIFDYWVKYWGFSLGLYFVDDDVFLFVWRDYNEVFVIPPKPNWDGKFIYERCELDESSVYDLEPIYQFSDTDQLWNEFRYKGKDLAYIISHSMVATVH